MDHVTPAITCQALRLSLGGWQFGSLRGTAARTDMAKASRRSGYAEKAMKIELTVTGGTTNRGFGHAWQMAFASLPPRRCHHTTRLVCVATRTHFLRGKSLALRCTFASLLLLPFAGVTVWFLSGRMYDTLYAGDGDVAVCRRHHARKRRASYSVYWLRTRAAKAHRNY
jgi:hypothetical protein